VHIFLIFLFLGGSVGSAGSWQTSDHEKVNAGGPGGMTLRLLWRLELYPSSQVPSIGGESSVSFFPLSSPGVDILAHTKQSHISSLIILLN
jgi:hypothetical protein